MRSAAPRPQPLRAQCLYRPRYSEAQGFRIRNLQIKMPDPVHAIAEKLRQFGQQAFLVGGGVRNSILNLPVTDWDISTSASPERVMQLFDHVKPTGIEWGTVTIFLPDRQKTPVHVSSFRHYAGHERGKADHLRFFRGEDIATDLSFRDFTMNAMAWNPFTGDLIDPFNGQDDLRARVLRAVGDPNHRFLEDPRRMMRAVRFAAKLTLELDSPLQDALTQNLGLLRAVKKRRIRNELLQILSVDKPSIAIQLLRTNGLLAILIPELEACLGLRKRPTNLLDVFEHSLKVCDLCPSDNPELRLAALLHDIGKPRCKTGDHGSWHFPDHEKIGAQMAATIMKQYLFRQWQISYVHALVARHGFYYKPTWHDGEVKRLIRGVPHEWLEDLFSLRVADVTASGKRSPDLPSLDELRTRIEAVRLRDRPPTVKLLKIDGEDVKIALGLNKPSEDIGRVLNWLLKKVIADPALNTRDTLMGLVLETPHSAWGR